MARSKHSDSTASNEEALVDAACAETVRQLFELAGRPAIRAPEPEVYAHQVRRFIAWLGDRSPVDGDPLTEGDARDWAVRDYERRLKAGERWKPASVNLALAALDSF
jgi:integrase/recombinase XerC